MSDWTIDTLREHLEAVIQLHEERALERQETANRAINAALSSAKELAGAAQDASDRAVQKAEDAANKRLEGMNEFRAAMGDMQSRFMPRTETEKSLQALDAKIDAISILVNEGRSQKAGAATGWAWAVGVLGLVALGISVAIAVAKNV